MPRTKTHYNEEEYGQAIVEKYPQLSGWTLLKLEERLEVRPLRAGAQAIYRANDVQRILDWLAKAKTEQRLVLRQGFLVAPEFDPQWQWHQKSDHGENQTP